MDECKDVLVLAAYNFTKMENTGSVTRDLKTFFLSDRFRKFVRNSGNNFSIGIPPIGDLPPMNMTAASSDAELDQFRARVQNMSDEHFAELSSNHFLQSVVNQDSIDAWRDCITRKQSEEIAGVISGTGSVVDVELKWNRRGPNDPPPEVKSFDFAPLIADELRITRGTKIDTDGITQRLRRVSHDEVLIALATTRGPWREVLPARPERKLVKIRGTASFDEHSDGADPFTPSGFWHGNHNGPTWVQYDFDGTYDVSFVEVGYLGLGNAAKPPYKHVAIKLKDTAGHWITIDAINDAHVGWGGPSFSQRVDPALRSVAMRVEMAGDGWKFGKLFSATGIRVD